MRLRHQDQTTTACKSHHEAQRIARPGDVLQMLDRRGVWRTFYNGLTGTTEGDREKGKRGKKGKKKGPMTNDQ